MKANLQTYGELGEDKRAHYLRTIDNLLGTSSPKTFCPPIRKKPGPPNCLLSFLIGYMKYFLPKLSSPFWVRANKLPLLHTLSTLFILNLHNPESDLSTHISWILLIGFGCIPMLNFFLFCIGHTLILAHHNITSETLNNPPNGNLSSQNGIIKVCNAASDKHDYTSDYHILHVYFFHIVFGENLDHITCKIKLCSN